MASQQLNNAAEVVVPTMRISPPTGLYCGFLALPKAEYYGNAETDDKVERMGFSFSTYRSMN